MAESGFSQRKVTGLPAQQQDLLLTAEFLPPYGAAPGRKGTDASPAVQALPPRSISMAGPMISCSAWPPPTVPRAVSAVSTSSAPGGAQGWPCGSRVTMAVTAGLPCRSVRHSSRIRFFHGASPPMVGAGCRKRPAGRSGFRGAGPSAALRRCIAIGPGPSLCANPANVSYSRGNRHHLPQVDCFHAGHTADDPLVAHHNDLSAWPSPGAGSPAPAQR